MKVINLLCRIGFFLLLPLFIGCGKMPETIHVTGISLHDTAITLIKGEKRVMEYDILPPDATDKSTVWASSDPSIAWVGANNLLSADKEGKTTITLTSKDGGKTASCDVIVEARIISVASITLNKTAIEMIEGDEEILMATVSPAEATDRSTTWISSDPSVATVDDNGRITALRAGKTTVAVKSRDGGKTASCDVTVRSNGSIDEYNEIEFKWD